MRYKDYRENMTFKVVLRTIEMRFKDYGKSLTVQVAQSPLKRNEAFIGNGVELERANGSLRLDEENKLVNKMLKASERSSNNGFLSLSFKALDWQIHCPYSCGWKKIARSQWNSEGVFSRPIYPTSSND